MSGGSKQRGHILWKCVSRWKSKPSKTGRRSHQQLPSMTESDRQTDNPSLSLITRQLVDITSNQQFVQLCNLFSIFFSTAFDLFIKDMLVWKHWLTGTVVHTEATELNWTDVLVCGKEQQHPPTNLNTVVHSGQRDSAKDGQQQQPHFHPISRSLMRKRASLYKSHHTQFVTINSALSVPAFQLSSIDQHKKQQIQRWNWRDWDDDSWKKVSLIALKVRDNTFQSKVDKRQRVRELSMSGKKRLCWCTFITNIDDSKSKNSRKQHLE